MKNHHIVHTIAKILLIIGGLNWGLIGLFQFNLVNVIFGNMEAVARIIYVLVGLEALYRLVFWIKGGNKK
ncbi:MAG TPA: DUF378 domain-containing protein [Parachlamydiales bacterium]|nr:DUF378 domain-containing protein [Parachlamydiales bacterium]